MGDEVGSATVTAAIAAVARAAGLTPNEGAMLTRALRAQGLWPTGKPGGGKFAAHVTLTHCASLLLGMAGLGITGSHVRGVKMVAALDRQFASKHGADLASALREEVAGGPLVGDPDLSFSWGGPGLWRGAELPRHIIVTAIRQAVPDFGEKPPHETS